MKTFEERFWPKVDKSGGPDACWNWTGASNGVGYGKICNDPAGRLALAHRASWEMTNGPIEGRLHCLHKCDNRRCCNPVHMFLGTNAENMADKVAKGRQARVRGSAQGRAKLTEADIPIIRHRCAAGELQRAIAVDYSVSQAVISCVATRRTWVHVN